MTARKRLDEMAKFMKISEGAWDLPRTKEDFDKLANILRSKEPNVKIYDMLFNVLGDDDLFDRLEKLDLQDHDAPETIIQWMKDQRKNPNSSFPNIWNTYQLSQREDSPMNEVGRTSLDDYREETDDEWEARVSQSPIEDEEYGPIARGKSDIIKKYGAQQSIKVTDLPLSDPLSEDDEECPNRCVDGVFPAPDYEGLEACRACDKFDKRYPKKGLDEDSYPEAEATRAMYAKHETDDFQNRGDNYPASDIPVSIEAYAYKNQASLEFSFKNTSEDDARAFVSQFMQQHGLPFSDIQAQQGSDNDFHDDWVTAEATYTVSKELDEVGAVKFDDYGAVPVYEDDPEGMGKYDVVIRSAYGEDYQTEVPIPYHHAEVKAEEAIEQITSQIDGDTIVKKIPAGGDMKYKIIDVDQDEVFWVVIENVTNEYDEGIELGSIVESILQEYPGQPKDYFDDEKFEREQAERSKHIQDQTKEFEHDTIDPEIEDEELGYRFD